MAVVNVAHVLDEVEAVLLGVGGVAGLDEAVVVVPVVGGIVGLDGTVEVVAGERDDCDVLIVIYWKRLRRGGMRQASPGTTDSPTSLEGRTVGVDGDMLQGHLMTRAGLNPRLVKPMGLFSLDISKQSLSPLTQLRNTLSSD